MLDVDNLIDYMLGIFYTGDGDATLSAFLANNMPNNWYGVRDRTNPDVGFASSTMTANTRSAAQQARWIRTGPFGGSNEATSFFPNPQWSMRN